MTAKPPSTHDRVLPLLDHQRLDDDLRALIADDGEGTASASEQAALGAIWQLARESRSDVEMAPPDHLENAVLLAEAIIRPPELRAAEARTAAQRVAAEQARARAAVPWWQRWTTWLGAGALASTAIIVAVTGSSKLARSSQMAMKESAHVTAASDSTPPPSVTSSVREEEAFALRGKDARLSGASPTDADAQRNNNMGLTPAGDAKFQDVVGQNSDRSGADLDLAGSGASGERQFVAGYDDSNDKAPARKLDGRPLERDLAGAKSKQDAAPAMEPTVVPTEPAPVAAPSIALSKAKEESRARMQQDDALADKNTSDAEEESVSPAKPAAVEKKASPPPPPSPPMTSSPPAAPALGALSEVSSDAPAKVRAVDALKERSAAHRAESAKKVAESRTSAQEARGDYTDASKTPETYLIAAGRMMEGKGGAGNIDDALALYKSAERADRTHRTGLSPLIGQLKIYQERIKVPSTSTAAMRDALRTCDRGLTHGVTEAEMGPFATLCLEWMTKGVDLVRAQKHANKLRQIPAVAPRVGVWLKQLQVDCSTLHQHPGCVAVPVADAAADVPAADTPK